MCYFQGLSDFKNEVLKKIEEFVRLCMERIGMKNMTLDIVFVDPSYTGKEGWPMLTLERLKQMQCKVIEVNPLAEFAGGGLFEWNQDKGIKICVCVFWCTHGKCDFANFFFFGCFFVFYVVKTK